MKKPPRICLYCKNFRLKEETGFFGAYIFFGCSLPCRVNTENAATEKQFRDHIATAKQCKDWSPVEEAR